MVGRVELTLLVITAQEDDEVKFKCKTKTVSDETEIKDTIKFTITADDGVKVKVKYENEVETDEQETEVETEYELVFDKIIEYTKSPASTTDTEVSLSRAGETPVVGVEDSVDLAYDWDIDTIVQEWFLDDLAKFSPVTSEGNLDKFSVSTTDGVATFFFTIARADTNELTANKMKIDFELSGFPWSESGDTQVALVSKVETNQEIKIDYDDDKKKDDDKDDEEDSDEPDERRLDDHGRKTTKDVEISFADATRELGFVPFGSYTWKDTAEVVTAPGPATRQASTTKTIDVVATSPSNQAYENMIAFSFVGAQLAEDIYWDPEAGVGYRADNSGAVSLGVMMGSVASVLFAALWM